MQCLDDALDKYRAYEVRLIFFYQSLSQLKLCWPEGSDQTLLSNCSTIWFAINENQTADYISARLGEYTLIVHEDSDGDSESKPETPQANITRSTSRNRSRKQIGRKLLKTEEIMQLDTRIAITFTPNMPPIATYLWRYFEPKPRKMGFLKAAVDTACLFLAVAFVAAIFTALLFKG